MYPAQLDFTGKIAIVTGAAHGFGREICIGLAASGAIVFAIDVLLDEITETANLCQQIGGTCHGHVVDITQQASVKNFIQTVSREYSNIDILVNNAGGVLGQVGQPLEDVTPEQWNAIFAVNLTGAFYLCQSVAPIMKAMKSGRIINISSGAGVTISLTGIQAYASAKAGLISLTRQLAHELGPWNITVNAIAPGFVLSNPNTQKQWEAMGSDGQLALVKNIALKRLGLSSDIANGVLFFSSELAGWISGQIIGIDGGK